MAQNERRLFLKTLALGIASLVAAPVLRVQEALAGALANPDNALVKALGYVSDAKKSKKAKKGQNCSSCQFYQGDEKSKQGKCQLITDGEVLATGYCNSYTARAKKA
jgi:hypothetical protein